MAAGAVTRYGHVPNVIGHNVAIRGPRPWVDVTAYGAKGNGVTDDTTAIDNAIASIPAGVGGAPGGGTLYFPPSTGAYRYNGAGLLNNPIADEIRPIIIAGGGVGSTILQFVAVTNPECIKLTYQSGIGSGHNLGSGIRDIAIVAPAGKDGVTIDNNAQWFMSNVEIVNGRNSLNVVESQSGVIDNVRLLSFTQYGLQITGESYAANRFSNLTADSAVAGSLYGVYWSKVGATDVGGTTFSTSSARALTGGWKFTAVAATNMFLFFNNCVADADFVDAAFVFQRTNKVLFDECWAVNTRAGRFGLYVEGLDTFNAMGGTAYGLGGDVALINGVGRSTFIGIHHYGGTTAYYSDNSAHSNLVITPNVIVAGSFATNAPSLLPVSATAAGRVMLPPFIKTANTGNVFSELGLQDVVSGNVKSIRIGTDNSLEFLSHAHAVIARLTDAGDFQLVPGVGWTDSAALSLDQAGVVGFTQTYARYYVLGKTVFWQILLSITSNAGSGNNIITLGSIPAAVAPKQVGADRVCGVFHYRDSGTAFYTGVVISQTSSTLRFQQDGTTALVGQQPNFAAANGDVLSMQLTYEIV